MTDFREYIVDTMIAESIISEVKDTELEAFEEGLVEIETELNEILGLKTAAKFVKKVGDKLSGADAAAEKKVEDVKKVGRAAALATQIQYNAKKDAVEKAVEKGSKAIEKGKKAVNDKTLEIGVKASLAKDKAVDAIASKKEELTKRVVELSKGARDEFKKIFKNITDISDDQKKTLSDLSGIYEKLASGKGAKVGGLDAIKIIATVIAGSSEAGQVPSYKVYSKTLEKLQSLPGFTAFKFTAKLNK